MLCQLQVPSQHKHEHEPEALSQHKHEHEQEAPTVLPTTESVPQYGDALPVQVRSSAQPAASQAVQTALPCLLPHPRTHTCTQTHA